MPTMFQDVPMGSVFTYGGILYRRKCVSWAEPVVGGDEKWFPNCEFVDAVAEALEAVPPEFPEPVSPSEPPSPSEA